MTWLDAATVLARGACAGALLLGVAVLVLVALDRRDDTRRRR